jgi:hypothetical protein
MVKTIQARIPLTLYNEIMKLKRSMEKETKQIYGKRKPVTFVKAAGEFHRRKNNTFFGGGLI